MSNKYETEYGVMFGDKHSFRDFGLYPKSKMIVNPPDVREVYVEVAGADGDLDITEALTGRANYESREGKFEFTVMDRARWDAIYSGLMNMLHGRKMRVILDEDPYYYYYGRVKIDSFKTNKRTATITIEGYFDPYKKSLIANSLDWLWDPFNFETDYAFNYGSMTVDGTLTVTLAGSRMPVTPNISVSSNMTVEIDGTTYQLTTGDNRIAGLVLDDTHEYEATFTGNGTVSIEFEIGSL